MHIINNACTYNLYILYYNISVLKRRYCWLQTLIYLRYHLFRHILAVELMHISLLTVAVVIFVEIHVFHPKYSFDFMIHWCWFFFPDSNILHIFVFLNACLSHWCERRTFRSRMCIRGNSGPYRIHFEIACCRYNRGE